MVLFLPFNVPSVVALEKFGLRAGILLGIGLSALGLILKIFINTSYSLVLIGQICLSVAQPFMYNAPAKVTSNWFPLNERSVSTMIGAQANVLGVVLGFLVPKAMITSYERELGPDGNPILTAEQEDMYKS